MSIPVILSLFAYAIVCLVTAAAALLAIHFRRPRQQAAIWAFGTALYAAYCLSRLTGAEEASREVLRESLRASTDYADRANFQGPLTALALIVIFAILALASWWWSKKQRGQGERLAHLGLTAMIGSVALAGLRVLSFHPLDALLYAGPIRPNWVLDGGFAAAVAVLAVLFCRRVASVHRTSASLRGDPMPRDKR